ncbi:A/G-specific adenine glycosylase [Ideonella sp.]|uniref:A/G-specific adenine glycosylase n=1 Tax=Ideonella sp. TaxID=1929293 RepID=UPI002B47ECAC|nr:A/G-specific adenine glycosylase [Ideonella sp.]HJV69565.1 A/G-specific adenine glycosylase [Ideonella sp.]
MNFGAPALAARVIAWQRRHGRHALPWQRTRDPYRVWLSEIMLQQTQVTTVLGYYQRFLEQFPDVSALAAAPADEVLALWAGLGYYSRARNLHRCAQAVVAEHGGRFPRSAAALATLPGIGRSTAAAIAAFCFDERVAILDGNVKRVLTRALGFGEDLAIVRHERALWARAEAMLPPSDGMVAYTQGLMDLGATLCSQRAPRCAACPLADDCVARREGRPEDYPVKTRKLKRGQRTIALLWLVQGDRVWLVRRPASGIWAGLWSLPEFDSIEGVREYLAGWPGSSDEVPAFTHVLTHLDLRLQPLRHALPARARRDAALLSMWPEGRWVSRSELGAYGLPAPVAKLLTSDQLLAAQELVDQREPL